MMSTTFFVKYQGVSPFTIDVFAPSNDKSLSHKHPAILLTSDAGIDASVVQSMAKNLACYGQCVYVAHICPFLSADLSSAAAIQSYYRSLNKEILCGKIISAIQAIRSRHEFNGSISLFGCQLSASIAYMACAKARVDALVLLHPVDLLSVFDGSVSYPLFCIASTKDQLCSSRISQDIIHQLKGAMSNTKSATSVAILSDVTPDHLYQCFSSTLFSPESSTLFRRLTEFILHSIGPLPDIEATWDQYLRLVAQGTPFSTLSPLFSSQATIYFKPRGLQIDTHSPQSSSSSTLSASTVYSIPMKYESTRRLIATQSITDECLLEFEHSQPMPHLIDGPATFKSISLAVVFIVEFTGSLISSLSLYWDQLSLRSQLETPLTTTPTSVAFTDARQPSSTPFKSPAQSKKIESTVLSAERVVDSYELVRQQRQSYKQRQNASQIMFGQEDIAPSNPRPRRDNPLTENMVTTSSRDIRTSSKVLQPPGGYSTLGTTFKQQQMNHHSLYTPEKDIRSPSEALLSNGGVAQEDTRISRARYMNHSTLVLGDD